jgi:hypothetical protein
MWCVVVVLAEASSSSASRGAALGLVWLLERWFRSFASACCVEVWCRPCWSSIRVYSLRIACGVLLYRVFGQFSS